MAPVPRWRWSLAVPLVALAALFGMHGLGDHSGAHAAAPVPGHHGAAHPGHAQPDASDGVADAALEGDASPVVLCLAVLLGGALSLALLAGVARRRPWLLPRLSGVPGVVVAGRDRDPPTPLTLCVCRC